VVGPPNHETRSALASGGVVEAGVSMTSAGWSIALQRRRQKAGLTITP